MNGPAPARQSLPRGGSRKYGRHPEQPPRAAFHNVRDERAGAGVSGIDDGVALGIGGGENGAWRRGQRSGRPRAPLRRIESLTELPSELVALVCKVEDEGRALP